MIHTCTTTTNLFILRPIGLHPYSYIPECGIWCEKYGPRFPRAGSGCAACLVTPARNVTNFINPNTTDFVSQKLTNPRPGWIYNLTLGAGFSSTTSDCTVTYSLDDVIITSHSPTNNSPEISGFGFGGVDLPVDGSDRVTPTASTQTFKISYGCLRTGSSAPFNHVGLWSSEED